MYFHFREYVLFPQGSFHAATLYFLVFWDPWTYSGNFENYLRVIDDIFGQSGQEKRDTIYFHFFNSPEPKVQYELLWSVSICRSSSIIRPSHIWTTSPLKPPGQFSLNFTWSLLSKGGWNFIQMVTTWKTKWPPCLYMLNILNNLLQNQEIFEAESWYISLGTQGLLNLFKWWPQVYIWFFYG